MSGDDFDKTLPEFLYGTFDWRVNGFRFESEPPPDLLAPAALENSNPWIVLAAVLHRARAGDHSRVSRLSAYFDADEPFALNRVALLLTGDLAPERDLKLLEDALRSRDADTRAYAAEAALYAGRLWLVPAMLEAWHAARTLIHRETIGYAISDLLEAKAGPIAAQAPIYNLPPRPPDSVANPRLKALLEKVAAEEPAPELFPQLVREASARLSEAAGTDRVTVWHGGVFDVTALAREFLAAVPGITPGACIPFRHKFEAATGVDCADFFDDFRPQPLVIEAALEEFLLSAPETRFKPGVRYFFGHPIPD
jgi:hypothetical protein